MARTFDKQVNRLASRRVSFTSMVGRLGPDRSKGYKRPGSMNAHKGTAERSKRGR